MKNSKGKVLLGMSGGVDSSVSAVLLLEQGYEVIGAFMKNWSGTTKVVDGTEEFVECDWRGERRDAMRVAAQLGIDFMTFDFEEEYRAKVVENLFEEYQAGRTPNPDILCNKYVKFDLFMREADRLGCDFVATGHYARIGYDVDEQWRGAALMQAKDDNKDQTYFLYAMPREALARVLFPLGNLTKPEVREIAEKHDLHNAEKKDSTGICFVGEVDIEEFLKARIPENPGPVVTTGGKTVGEHRGLAYYTIGQRQGLGVVGGGPPYYVVRKDAQTNTLIVGTEVDPGLFRSELVVSQLNLLVPNLNPTFECSVRIRYRQDLQKAKIQYDGEKLFVTFNEPQRAVTPGQSLVMYSDNVPGVVLGGGIIE